MLTHQTENPDNNVLTIPNHFLYGRIGRRVLTKRELAKNSGDYTSFLEKMDEGLVTLYMSKEKAVKVKRR